MQVSLVATALIQRMPAARTSNAASPALVRRAIFQKSAPLLTYGRSETPRPLPAHIDHNADFSSGQNAISQAGRQQDG